ncbi:mechanosensitive ion channel protein [Babesia ovis]|uniref:Mechanosensitive ion channel protein n=1 Tax=Babesia ovis TaxID=5869 RepID=A0A9W5TAU3_BABOV|nr:mechanosensitive ion channel protein [Babesia ovis]
MKDNSNHIDVGDNIEEKVLSTIVDDEDAEESRVSRRHNFFRGVICAIFPDGQPPAWLAINIAILFTYALFNFNAYTVAFDANLPQDEMDAINYSFNVLWCLIFILVGNTIMYLCVMLLRFILLKMMFYLRLSRHAYVFAMINMLDPSIFYVLWAAMQALVWQIFVSRIKGDVTLYIIDSTLFSKYVSSYLIFKEEGLVWVSCAVQLHLILAIRSMALSLISFTFELNLLVTSNEAVKRYLRLYANIRKFNIDWLELVISRPEIAERIRKAFSGNHIGNKMSPLVERCNESTYDFHSAYSLRILNESHDTAYMEYFKTKEDLSVPSESAEAIVEQSSASAFSNWLLICYVMRVPPVVSLIKQDVALKGRDMVPKCAAALFEQMYFTLVKAHEERDAVPEVDSEPNTETKSDSKQNNPETKLSEGDQADVDTPDNETSEEKPTSATEPEPTVKDDSAMDLNDKGDSEEPQGESSSGKTRNTSSIDATEQKSQQSAPDDNENAQTGSKVNPKLRNNRLVSMMKMYEFRHSLEGNKQNNAQQHHDDAAGIVTPDFHFNSGKDHDDRFLSAEQLKSFLVPEEADTIVSLLDLSGHGRINVSMLHQALLNLYNARKKFKNVIKGQDSIFKVLLRLLSCGTWICALVVMAFMAGITAEAIVVSGAALMSALTVALSYLYTNFLTSVIFVAISNPYNVGDRVRLNDGEPLIVKKIRTYTTEFVTIMGKGLVFQNAVLANMKITNETRSVRATFDFEFAVDYKTTDEQLTALNDHLLAISNSRPNDFVKDGVCTFYCEVKPGHCLKIAIWVTCIESWGNWQRIFHLRSELMEATMRYCRENNIGYTTPVQPIAFPKQIQASKPVKRERVPLGKRP